MPATASGRQSQDLRVRAVQGQILRQANDVEDLSAVNSRLREQLSGMTEQLEEAAMSDGAMQVSWFVSTASISLASGPPRAAG